MNVLLISLVLLLPSFDQAVVPAPAQKSSTSAPNLSKPADDAATNQLQARYVLEQTIKALGGERYLNLHGYVQSGRYSGVVTPSFAGQAMSAVYSRVVRLPESERYEYQFQRETLPADVLLPFPLPGGKSAPWTILHLADKGWEITYRGVFVQSAKDLDDYNRWRQYDLDAILRIWFADPKTTFFFDGQTIEETKVVYKLNLLSSKNQNVTLYIDSKTFLPIKKTFSYRDAIYKDIQVETELFDKYRDEEGFNTPHVITRMKNNGIVYQRFIQKVEFNPVLDEKLWAPPTESPEKKKK